MATPVAARAMGRRQLSMPQMRAETAFKSPETYANRHVQECDGNFFEQFAALLWKQENRRLRTESEDAKDADRPPPCETSVISHHKLHRLSKKEYELLYIEVLYTIKHKIGTTSGGHSPFIHDLYQYAQESFGMAPEDHARLLACASKEKPPIVILNATVLEAKDLEAKDANGFSDPYCMLGIMPGRLVFPKDEGASSEDEKMKKKGGPLKKFSESFRKGKKNKTQDSLPAKYIQTTSVKADTLTPVWREKFRFDLEDVNTDALHLDIWDHDDEGSVFEAAKKLNEVSGFRGLNRFFKQIAQSARTSSADNVDDFLGCINVKLADIPSTGTEKWFDLEARSARSNVQGKICLRLNLATREDRGIPEEDNWTDVRQHEDLMGIFIEHEIRKCDEVFQWNGELPQAAQTILHQHAIQGDITEVQQAMCRWIAYSRKHMEHPFDYEFLSKLLKSLEASWTAGSTSRDEEESVASSFNQFIDFCLALIRRQREVFPPANRIAFHRLEYMLKCLSQIYDMKLYKKCCPFQKELSSEVIAAVKKGTLEWYEKQNGYVRPKIKSDEDNLHSMIALVNIINTDMYKGWHYYNKLFYSVVGVHYFTLAYKHIEKLLADDVSALLDNELSSELSVKLNEVDFDSKHIDSPAHREMASMLFELYLALQEFCKFKDHLHHSDRHGLTITRYHEWFKNLVHNYFAYAKHKLIHRVRKSVEIDQVETVDPVVKHSTSAVDVCCCFNQIVEFWKRIDWPDAVGSYSFVMRLTDDLCQAAMLYADLIHEKLKKAGYYDEEGQFDVTEQLCITINNIEQVRKALLELPESLKFDAIVHAVEKVHGEQKAKKTKVAFNQAMKQADDDIESKIKQVVDRVADRMRPDIKKDVFHLCWAPEALPAEKAIGHLMEYLDSNLYTLNCNLLRSNFDRILDSIWVEVLEEIQEVMLKEEEGKTMAYYERLYDACKIMEEFFYAGKKGLPLDRMYSPQYKNLLRLLEYNKSDTNTIIEYYFREKEKEQKRCESCPYGTLTVRCFYKHDLLGVEVLNAKDLIPLDSNGLSDPYVVLQLMPAHIFQDQPEQKTRVLKKTLNPVFDEAFEFSVTKAQCVHRGACVMLTVMDHDLIMSNDFAGEAFFDLNDVPGIHGEKVEGYEALKEIHLPLMQPVRKEKGALSVLQSRVEDRDAQEFVKMRMSAIDQAAANCK